MSQNTSFINKLRYNVLFETVNEQILHKVFQDIKEVEYRTGEIIFEDTSEGDCLYLIISGNVRICKATKSGEDAILAILDVGDFFGEMELIDGSSRSATAIAHTDCKLIILNSNEFKNLITEDHAFTQNLLKMMSMRIRVSDKMMVQNIDAHFDTLTRQLNKMHKLIEATKIVNSSLDTTNLLKIILQTATSTVESDRGTLYLVDEAKNELWSTVLQGSEMVEIRLPIGKGIAGYVAATGETINIPDAYCDPRFNPEVDKKSGYRTSTILCMPMKNKDGIIIGVFQLLNKRNGTFTKEDEEFIDGLSVHASLAIENAQLAQQMVSNERLSAVGKMASTIIHDIKNPMGTLRVYAQVMKKKSADAEVTKLADEMIRQVDRFVNMTQEILDFSRGVSSMNIQETEFVELVDMILVFIEKDLSKRNIKIATNNQFSGKINVDQDKLMRVFFNIAGNAADAMPEGGTLTVNTFSRDKNVVVEFIDTGTGMPPDVKAKIFEPFITYGKKHGTGLGMAIVKKIIDDHNGKIEIDSELNKGTIVRLFLPIS